MHHTVGSWLLHILYHSSKWLSHCCDHGDYLFSCSSCVNILCNNLHGSVFVLYFKATSICLGTIKIGLTPVMAGLFMPFFEVLMPEEHGIFLSS